MTDFGWSLPPGCDGPLSIHDGPVDNLRESVWVLCEDEGMPDEWNNKIMRIIDDWRKSAEYDGD